ncbi:MAG TPA: metallophosphoesterase [Candidatus Brocadiia bacterium]|nr:metallophosphoesterase [Candidatus Brocadiia bacterium]
MKTPDDDLTRRDFLSTGAAAVTFALGSTALRAAQAKTEGDGILRFGVFTDSHYADKETAGTRYYRQSIPKLETALAEFRKQKLDFMIELGDFIDGQPTPEDEMAKSRDFKNACSVLSVPAHHIIGNHDLAVLNKEQFLSSVGAEKSYYSFSCGAFTGAALDANFNKDGTPYECGRFDWTQTYVPKVEREWLEAELDRVKKPVIVFVHQCLDDDGAHGVRNAPEVRAIFEKSGKVAAVLQGHKHSGGFSRIAGIPYFTFKAMVEGPYPENNAFAVVEAAPGGRITIRGFGKQPSSDEPMAG